MAAIPAMTGESEKAEIKYRMGYSGRELMRNRGKLVGRIGRRIVFLRK